MKEEIELKREMFTIFYDVHLGKMFTDQAVNKILDLILSKIVIEKQPTPLGSITDKNVSSVYYRLGFNGCIDQLEEIKNKLRG